MASMPFGKTCLPRISVKFISMVLKPEYTISNCSFKGVDNNCKIGLLLSYSYVRSLFFVLVFKFFLLVTSIGIRKMNIRI